MLFIEFLKRTFWVFILKSDLSFRNCILCIAVNRKTIQSPNSNKAFWSAQKEIMLLFLEFSTVCWEKDNFLFLFRYRMKLNFEMSTFFMKQCFSSFSYTSKLKEHVSSCIETLLSLTPCRSSVSNIYTSFVCMRVAIKGTLLSAKKTNLHITFEILPGALISYVHKLDFSSAASFWLNTEILPCQRGNITAFWKNYPFPK